MRSGSMALLLAMVGLVLRGLSLKRSVGPEILFDPRP